MARTRYTRQPPLCARVPALRRRAASDALAQPRPPSAAPPSTGKPAQSLAVHLPNPLRRLFRAEHAENTKRIARSRSRARPSVLRRLGLRLRFTPGLFNKSRVTASRHTTLRVSAGSSCGCPCSELDPSILTKVDHKIARRVPHKKAPILSLRARRGDLINPCRSLMGWDNLWLSAHDLNHLLFGRTTANRLNRVKQPRTAYC